MTNNIVLSPISLDDLEKRIENIVLRCFEKKHSLKPAPTNQQNDELLKAKEVCKLLNISLVTLWTWKKLGKIPYYNIGTRIFFKKHEVIASLNLVNAENC